MGVLSVASLALGYLLTVALHAGLGLPAEGAFALAVMACSVMNFFGFRYFVFLGVKGSALRQAAKFFPSTLLFRALEVVLFSIINRALDNYHLAYLATAATSATFKLLVFRTFVFKR